MSTLPQSRAVSVSPQRSAGRADPEIPRAFLSGWGKVPVVPGSELRSVDLVELSADLKLARGLGRAYGDAALPAPGDLRVGGTRLADRILSFDANTGVLTAEAGLSLDHIYQVFLRRGFFTPVSPGTRFVTLGGMVACDVHGKNHHREGCFGRHVVSLKLRVGDGRIIDCSRTEHPDLFLATIGGMGLTGPILEVTVQLARVPSPWIYEEREQVPDIDRFIEKLKAAAAEWPMTVGWIDCLAKGSATGRGVIIRGRWARPDEAPPEFPRGRRQLSVPIEMPTAFLQPVFVRTFNAVNYWWHSSGRQGRVIHPQAFFYPLDSIENWRRLYGHRGRCCTRSRAVPLPSPSPRTTTRWTSRCSCALRPSCT